MNHRNYDENKFLSDHCIEALLIKLHYQHSEMKILSEQSRTTSMVLKEFYNKVQRSLFEKECPVTARNPFKSRVNSNLNFHSCLNYIDLVDEWDQKLFNVGTKVKALQNEFYRVCDECPEEMKRRINASIAREQLKYLSKMRSKSPKMKDVCFVIWKAAIRFHKRANPTSGQWTMPKALETLIGATESDEDVPKNKRLEKKRMFKKMGRFSS